MAPLRMFFLFLAFPCLIPGTAAAQLGFDPDPPEFVEDVPPPDDSVPSILDEIDLDDLL
jgi:hypothetical protein